MRNDGSAQVEALKEVLKVLYEKGILSKEAYEKALKELE